jgi:hypothetical protein
MNRQYPVALAVAALSFALFYPQTAHARNPVQSADNTLSPSAQSDAMQMVSAQANLIGRLDARKVKACQQFRAALSGTVHLKNGTELPHGTLLIGTVATDQMESKGQSRLALSFTQAQLKDGKMIPIKATIVGIYPPADNENSADAEDSEGANVWTPTTLQIDQVGVLAGIDLHSKIDGSTSGVFVSSTKDDVKLADGSQIALAIAADSGSQQSMASPNGGQ